MAVNLSPVGGVAAQFFTNTGAVLTGGKLYTYLAGTTTPAPAYTSSNGATAWTNPIVLDAAGRVPNSGEIWLTDGINYKFILKDSNDVLIATYDNVSGINSNFIAFTNQQEIVTATANQTVFNLSISYSPGTNSLSVFVDGVNQYGPGAQYAYVETDSDTVTFVSGLHVGAQVKFTTSQLQGGGSVDASQVSYIPPFTGSVATNVEAKLAQVVSVQDFGAVGDGVTDDTVAIQTAWAAIVAGNKSLYFPAGTYLVTNTASVITASGNLDGVTIYGDGPGASVLKRKFGIVNPSSSDGAYAAVGHYFDFTGGVKNIEIRDLGFEGYNSSSGDPNIPVGATNHFSYYNSSGAAVFIVQTGVTTNTIENVNVRNIYVYKGYSSVFIQDDTATAKNITIKDVTKYGGYYGMNVLGCSNANIDTVRVESSEGSDSTWDILRGLYFSSSDSNISNCVFNGMEGVGLFVRAFSPYNVRNVNISNVYINTYGSGILLQSKTDASIRSVQISDVAIRTTTANPAGALNLYVDGSLNPNISIENVSVNGLATSGFGYGVFFGADNTNTSAQISGVNITNVTAEAANSPIWLTNSSVAHSTNPATVNNLAVTNVSIITNSGSNYGKIALINFVDSVFENVRSTSTNPILVYNNKRVAVSGNFLPSATVTTTSANYPILFNGFAYPEGKTIYVSSSATEQVAPIGTSVGSPAAADDMYKWFSFLAQYQEPLSYLFPNVLGSFNCTGTFSIPNNSALAIAGTTIFGGTFAAFSLRGCNSVKIDGVTITGAVETLNSKNIQIYNCTFSGAGVTAISSLSSDVDCSTNSFAVTTAFYANGPGARIHSTSSTGTSTTAYSTQLAGQIVRRNADTLTGATTNSSGGTTTTY